MGELAAAITLLAVIILVVGSIAWLFYDWLDHPPPCPACATWQCGTCGRTAR